MSYVRNNKSLASSFGGVNHKAMIEMKEAINLIFIHNISTVPGSAYGESTERFLRISIGTESEERIYEALNIIKLILEFT